MPEINRGLGHPRREVVGDAEVASSQLSALPDRALHDRVINYLTDASQRSTINVADFLDEFEAERAGRFSRFLARRYYRDRLIRGFRYSPVVVPGVAAERLVESTQFDCILDTCVLGSFTTAQRVGDLAVAQLLEEQCDKPWWTELLEYERAFFLQLATSGTLVRSELPQKNVSTIARRFSFAMTDLIGAIKSHQSLDRVFEGELTLLFSRNGHGRICVVDVDPITYVVFEAVDGHRTEEEIAQLCGISPEENRRILGSLSDIGSIVLALPDLDTIKAAAS